jgi:transmembrane sensor
MTHPDAAMDEALLEEAMIRRQRMAAPSWSVEDDARLEAWLQADERHAQAFARSGAVFDIFEPHAAAPELLAARRALLGRVRRMTRDRAQGWSLRLPGRRIAAGLAAAALLLAAGGYGLVQRGDIYQTGRGERRVVTLDDGSKLSLDAQTKVQVHYGRDARKLRLLRGQARFDVAHNLARPFSVRAGGRTVVATGTAFNIDLLGTAMRVTLIEGRVLVYADEAPKAAPGKPAEAPRPVELRSGQQLLSTDRARRQVVAAVDLEETTAWQGGKLVFDDEPLAQAVARVNRYAERKITIADPAAGAIRVSGVFDVGDSNAFLESVTGFLPVAATEGPDGVSLRSTGPN